MDPHGSGPLPGQPRRRSHAQAYEERLQLTQRRPHFTRHFTRRGLQRRPAGDAETLERRLSWEVEAYLGHWEEEYAQHIQILCAPDERPLTEKRRSCNLSQYMDPFRNRPPLESETEPEPRGVGVASFPGGGGAAERRRQLLRAQAVRQPRRLRRRREILGGRLARGGDSGGAALERLEGIPEAKVLEWVERWEELVLEGTL